MVQVALLRAVNLGPYNKVAMSALRDLLTRLGFEEPQSLLQSGNLVFRAARPAGASLERLLETETEKCLPLRVEFFVRSAKPECDTGGPNCDSYPKARARTN
jgi:uncharacterized protein (DUF1697 family)